jgi:23S rRNA G2069 N7-methylase RlmK/C1962 C5-methylase RlmI
VDLSRTYLDWAKRNFDRNQLWTEHQRLVRADAIEWTSSARDRFDLVLCAPPTYSKSKAMRRGDFDVQRDHAALVHAIVRLLSPTGTVVLTTNLRTFELDTRSLTDLAVEEITRWTTPHDFLRRAPHRAFRVRRSGAAPGSWQPGRNRAI